MPPTGPVYPALQLHTALPAGELEFDGQAIHVETNVLQEATKPEL
jgi:hypothetical protein